MARNQIYLAIDLLAQLAISAARIIFWVVWKYLESQC